MFIKVHANSPTNILKFKGRRIGERLEVEGLRRGTGEGVGQEEKLGRGVGKWDGWEEESWMKTVGKGICGRMERKGKGRPGTSFYTLSTV